MLLVFLYFKANPEVHEVGVIVQQILELVTKCATNDSVETANKKRHQFYSSLMGHIVGDSSFNIKVLMVQIYLDWGNWSERSECTSRANVVVIINQGCQIWGGGTAPKNESPHGAKYLARLLYCVLHSYTIL